jgi:uncharacterized protein (TIGR02270 family)
MPASASPMASRVSIPNILAQHAEEASMLREKRAIVSHAPHLYLDDLGRLDQRLLAHLDGLSVASENAWAICDAALDEPSAGVIFTAAVRALEEGEQDRLDPLFVLAESGSAFRSGLSSAFGWLSAVLLRGVVANLLASEDPVKRTVGIAACAMHRVDPGPLSARQMSDPNPMVRSRALRIVGEIGSGEATATCLAATRDDNPDCRFWAATSLVLLGNTGATLDALRDFGLLDGPYRVRSFRLAMQATKPAATHEMLRELAKDPTNLPWLIQGSGISGDPVYAPWLIKQMSNEKVARPAGDAFSLITGIDIGRAGLDRGQPNGFESGPNDDPDDSDVEMDPDDGVAWPDPPKIEKWWAANGSGFQKGTRYFMGEPVTREHCIHVLKNGYQRQRILAANYLCLLEPGTPLFNTSAPAWRQQRLLAKMT